MIAWRESLTLVVSSTSVPGAIWSTVVAARIDRVPVFAPDQRRPWRAIASACAAPRNQRHGMACGELRRVDAADRAAAEDDDLVNHRSLRRGRRGQVQEELLVACGAGDRRRHHRDSRQAAGGRRLGDARDHRLVDRRIGDDAVRADLVASGLELRLSRARRRPAPLRGRGQRRQDVPQRDEGDVDGREASRDAARRPASARAR